MKNWMMSGLALLLLTTTIALGFVACAPKNRPQDDCGFVQNVYGERISWKGKLPVVMYVHQSVPKEYLAAIHAAAETWNKAAHKKVIQIEDQEIRNSDGLLLTEGGAKKDEINMITYESTWDPQKPSEQARTSIYWKGDQIKEADIRINNKNFTFYWQVPTEPNQVSIESLMIHEMGHVLGLKHKDSNSSVMATFLASNTERVQLATTDNVALSCEY